MANLFQSIGDKISNITKGVYTAIRNWWVRNQWKLMTIVFLLFLFYNKEINFSFKLSTAQPVAPAAHLHQERSWQERLFRRGIEVLKNLVPAERQISEPYRPDETLESLPEKPFTENMSLFGGIPSYEKKTSSKELEKHNRQLAYVARFAKVARAEMKKFGIPASITLAQGLIETRAGMSRLATKNNNHFGMKCFSKSCPKGHCSNFNDDHHKDFFRKYKSAWLSYRSHSQLLAGSDRYKSLFENDIMDYRAWAYGLKKAGYATDSRYAEKLIQTIEDLQLYKYDR